MYQVLRNNWGQGQLKEVEEIVKKIDTLKEQFTKNREKIHGLDARIQDLDFNASNAEEVLANITEKINNLKQLNEKIEENMLDLERKIQILSRFELEKM